jgi:hypothetical protein
MYKEIALSLLTKLYTTFMIFGLLSRYQKKKEKKKRERKEKSFLHPFLRHKINLKTRRKKKL